MAVSFNNLTSRHQGSKSRQHVLQQDMIYGTPPGDTTIRSLFIHKQRPFLEEGGEAVECEGQAAGDGARTAGAWR